MYLPQVYNPAHRALKRSKSLLLLSFLGARARQIPHIISLSPKLGTMIIGQSKCGDSSQNVSKRKASMLIYLLDAGGQLVYHQRYSCSLAQVVALTADKLQ